MITDFPNAGVNQFSAYVGASWSYGFTPLAPVNLSVFCAKAVGAFVPGAARVSDHVPGAEQVAVFTAGAARVGVC